MDDDALIAAVAAGDHDALHEIFMRHAPWVAGRLRRTLPADAVEDVLQETFIAVWRGASSYKGDGELGAWVWGIARRQSALWSRRHGRPATVIEPQPSADPATAALAHVELQQVLSVVSSGGCDQRRLLELMFIQDRPVAEVAEMLAIPPGTVKSRVYRLRRLLRQALQRGEADHGASGY